MSVTTPELGELPWPISMARSWPRRAAGAVWLFARRSPLSAFWGVVAVAIIAVAIAAPLIAPYAPLKSDFRHMTKAPDAVHWWSSPTLL